MSNFIKISPAGPKFEIYLKELSKNTIYAHIYIQRFCKVHVSVQHLSLYSVFGLY